MSLVLPSVQQSHVTDSDEARMCLQSTQAAIKKADYTVVWPCLSLSLSHSLSHTHTHMQMRKTLYLNSQ